MPWVQYYAEENIACKRRRRILKEILWHLLYFAGNAIVFRLAKFRQQW